MRIVNWKEFVELPAGTLFYADVGGRNDFDWGSFSIKRDTCFLDDGHAFDYFEQPLDEVDHNDSNEFWELLEDMKENGASYQLSDACGRNGMFDQTGIYLIFEKPDLLMLQRYIADAINVTKGEDHGEIIE